jgi:hypothetical protein
MSLDGISTIFRGVRETACISDYAGDSLAAHRVTHTREVLSKRLTSSPNKNCFQTLATERPWLKNKLKHHTRRSSSISQVKHKLQLYISLNACSYVFLSTHIIFPDVVLAQLLSCFQHH